MINSQHHKLSPEKMFVLKGVIVTENDLGLEKMGEIFLYWRNDFWETPDFYIYVTINCKCYVFFLVFTWFLRIFFTGGNDFWETPDFWIFVTVNCNFMVFLDFTVLWFFLLEVTTFRRPQIFTFLWGVNPIFFVHYYTLFREWELGGFWGKKLERVQWGKADVGIRSKITRRAWYGPPQKRPDYSRWSASNLA